MFEINSAHVFSLTGPNYFASENNTYVGNTGSVLSAGSIFTEVVMIGDIIRNNIGAAISADDLKNIYISDTEFMNNTSEGATIGITSSVHFTIINCQFRQNVMESQGILSISNADRLILNKLHVENNNVTIGSMIMIKNSINTTVLSSYFRDNLCSKLPCAVSVKKSDSVNIENFLLVSNMSVTYTISQSKDNPGAVDVDASKIALENVHSKGVPWYVSP